MSIPGREESRKEKRRSVLLLSLILLVWNIAASAYHLASVGPSSPAGPVEGFLDGRAASDNEAAFRSAESPHRGPLTIKQKFLLGKRVDINKASLAEISELPGLSDAVAAAVVEERERLGGFRSPEDLLGAKGIGRRRLQKILPFLVEIPNN